MLRKTLLTLFFCFLSSIVLATDAPDKIPGLLPADVYQSLLDMGFEQDSPSIISDQGIDHYRWEFRASTQDQLSKYYVKIWGHGGVDNVYSINVTSTDLANLNKPASKLTKQVVSLIASIPFEGSKPNQAKDWVISHIDIDESETLFSSVRHYINSTSTGFNMLEIKMPIPESDKVDFLL